MPDSNDSTANECARTAWLAARASAALFDLPGWAHIELTGADRAKFLHNFCTNDVRGLAPGQACEAFVTSVQGKILAHVFIFAEPDALWIDAAPGLAEKVVNHLSKYHISEDVEIADRTGDLSAIYLVGPRSDEVLARCRIDVPTTLPGHAQAALPQRAVSIRRNDFLRMPGYMLVTHPTALAALREQLLKGGAVAGGKEAFDALRITAGFPEYGADITEANLAQEANRTAQAISFTKGCYLGQEPIARIDALGHVNQQMRLLRLVDGPRPAVEDEIVAGETDPRPAGRVTSVAIDYETGLPIALALVRRGHDALGATVGVHMGTKTVPATICWPEG